ADHRRTYRTGQHHCAPRRLALRAAQVTEDEHAHSTRLHNAQHHAAQRAEACCDLCRTRLCANKHLF
ncbi:hypothetical protein A2U01_0087695, partial [Trifolium medium]|nr:hypothetical protein [Trifolium medium]